MATNDGLSQFVSYTLSKYKLSRYKLDLEIQVNLLMLS